MHLYTYLSQRFDFIKRFNSNCFIPVFIQLFLVYNKPYQYPRLKILFRHGMEKCQISHEELALAARITKQTLYNRYNKPDGFRLYELRLVSIKLHIPLSDLLGDRG